MKRWNPSQHLCSPQTAEVAGTKMPQEKTFRKEKIVEKKEIRSEGPKVATETWRGEKSATHPGGGRGSEEKDLLKTG